MDLPLFPLGSVLFPGLVLPLHIFEPRYRQLVEDLLELPEAEQRFGVVAIRQGHEVGTDGVHALYDIGCIASVRRVEPQDDGRYLVVSVGTSRFRLTALDATAAAYLRADVEELGEETGEDAEGQVPPVQRAFRLYLDALATARETEIEVPELPSDPRHLSYLVAATTVVDNADKQALLAAASVADRLRAEHALLRRETALLTTLTAAPALDLTRLPQSPN